MNERDRIRHEVCATAMDMAQPHIPGESRSEMTYFKETDEVGFDSFGGNFAVHKRCGAKLVECWTVSTIEGYNLRRNGTTKRAYSGGASKECDGVWCELCNVRVVLEKIEPAKQEVRNA